MLVVTKFVIKNLALFLVKVTIDRQHTSEGLIMENATASWFHCIIIILGLVLPVLPIFLEVGIFVTLLIHKMRGEKRCCRPNKILEMIYCTLLALKPSIFWLGAQREKAFLNQLFNLLLFFKKKALTINRP